MAKQRKRRENEKEIRRRRDKSCLRATMFKKMMEERQLRAGMLARNEVLAQMGFKVEDCEAVVADVQVTKEAIMGDFHIVPYDSYPERSYPERSPSPERPKANSLAKCARENTELEYESSMQARNRATRNRAKMILLKNCCKT